MNDQSRLIFLHGLESSSQGVKASLLRGIYPGMLTPDFKGSLEERMEALYNILGGAGGWTIIGSSFGGLMGALFTCRFPEQVRKLILLAPALIWPDFASLPPSPVNVPVVIYHGVRDELIPVELVKQLAERVFPDLIFNSVDDDHGLYSTVHAIDWPALIEP